MPSCRGTKRLPVRSLSQESMYPPRFTSQRHFQLTTAIGGSGQTATRVDNLFTSGREAAESAGGRWIADSANWQQRRPGAGWRNPCRKALKENPLKPVDGIQRVERERSLQYQSRFCRGGYARNAGRTPTPWSCLRQQPRAQKDGLIATFRSPSHPDPADCAGKIPSNARL